MEMLQGPLESEAAAGAQPNYYNNRKCAQGRITGNQSFLSSLLTKLFMAHFFLRSLMRKVP